MTRAAAPLPISAPITPPSSRKRLNLFEVLKFSFRGVEIRMHGVRQDVPPRMERIDSEIVLDTDEPDRRLELLHDNVKKYGIGFNTVAPGTDMKEVLVRAKSHQP